jgi:hypothetical protein
MLPGKARLACDPVDRPPVATVDEAAARIADLTARMERGTLDLDEGQILIGALQAFIARRNLAQLESQAVEMRAEIETLRGGKAELAQLKTAMELPSALSRRVA